MSNITHGDIFRKMSNYDISCLVVECAYCAMKLMNNVFELGSEFDSEDSELKREAISQINKWLDSEIGE